MRKQFLLILALLMFNASSSFARGMIVNGQEIDYNSDLAKMIVFISTPDKNGVPHVCTGTFISNEFILTAAHCIADDKDTMSTSFRRSDFRETQEVNDIKISSVHKIYIPQMSKYKEIDLGLIRFDGGLPKGAQVAQLPDVGQILPQVFSFTAVGYGAREGVEDHSSEGLGDLRFKKMTSNFINPKNHFFTVDQHKNDGGVCYGDSGGPALIQNTSSSHYTVIGVAIQIMFERKIEDKEIEDNCKNESRYVNLFPLSIYLKYNMKHLSKSAAAAE